MKKILLTVFLGMMLWSCEGLKATQNYIAEGNYDHAIEVAVGKLKSNKDKKGNQDYVYALADAYAKAQERDTNKIKALVMEGNPQKLEQIHSIYNQLNNRQEKIKPLLPLRLLKEGTNATFAMENYTEQLISSKKALAKFLLENAKALVGTKDKMNSRRAYNDLINLENLYPGYAGVDAVKAQALKQGIDYVEVYTANESNKIIPQDLQNELLDFNTYGLNDIWSIYHPVKQTGLVYDFAIELRFFDIEISPEQQKEKVIQKEKQVQDGTMNLTDNRGNVVKDSLGQIIKVPKYKTLKATVREFSQYKSCFVSAQVDYINLKTNTLMQSYPLETEFVFDNVYSIYRGDKNAIETNYYKYFGYAQLPFPSNEQMVYDAGEDIKMKLKAVLKKNKLR